MQGLEDKGNAREAWQCRTLKIREMQEKHDDLMKREMQGRRDSEEWNKCFCAAPQMTAKAPPNTQETQEITTTQVRWAGELIYYISVHFGDNLKFPIHSFLWQFPIAWTIWGNKALRTEILWCWRGSHWQRRVMQTEEDLELQGCRTGNRLRPELY